MFETGELVPAGHGDGEIDKLIAKEELLPSKLTKEEEENLKSFAQEMIGDDKFTLVLENLREEDAPMTIVKPEFMRRWADMQKMSNNANFMNNELQKSNFVINTNNPLIINLLNFLFV